MDAPGNIKNLLKQKKKNKFKEEKKQKPKTEKERNKSAVRKLLTEGGDIGQPDNKVKFVQRSYETNRQFKERMNDECQNALTIAAGQRARNVPKEFIQAEKKDKNKYKVETERDFKRAQIEADHKAVQDEKKLDKVRRLK